MNEEFLLQAVGHIDEDLIVQAEEYHPAKRPSLRRPLAGLAACLAVVFGLYWGMNNLGMGSGASNGNASASGGGSAAGGESQENSNSGMTDNSQGSGGDVCPAIWVDGQLYWSTGQTISGQMDENAILGTTTYTDDLPDEDGEANFNREGTLYARTDEGIAVEIDGEWVLFTPDGP